MARIDELLAELRRLHPRLIDLSLKRIERLLDKLGRPQECLPPVIHIAGTNGKGSVAAMLRAMFEAAGRRVHVYTSPHLVRFNERIKLAGSGTPAQPINEEVLANLLERVAQVNAGDPITYFEITTAAAFVAFAEAPADAAILEVGLGGRLDATNVVRQPRLTIITPISIDHADKLGGTLASIAAEKAGILKAGVPAVVSQQPEEAMPVIRAAAARVGAPLRVWGEDYEGFEQRGRLVFQRPDILLDMAKPSLIGRHQIVNAATAVAAALELGEFGLDERAIERGLVSAEWPARMQLLNGGPITVGVGPGSEVWLDGGHNPAGGAALAQTLADLEERAPKPLHLIVGMMGLKDAAGFLAPFRGLAREVVTVPIPGAHEAPYSPERLAQIAGDLGFASAAAAGVEDAITRLERKDAAAKRILICGSLYLAGQVLAKQMGVEPQAN
ncbi:MAG TPA: folylpolyglutamate synthase/dihydrofolate synthase family protein [Hyphomicrobiaceae bacterium]|nr:folylpolyglutamate synthase/dihydrofolate synthase family protein [Hyphomicrobiaceae bacterium]